MNTTSNLWAKLQESKEYRDEFAALQLKRGVPFQIRNLLKKRGWKQDELAQKSGLTQGVVSRAQNPNYGNLTINTISRIAAGFDVAFIGRFVPFSELINWFENLSEESGNIESFKSEVAKLNKALRRISRFGKRGYSVEKSGLVTLKLPLGRSNSDQYALFPFPEKPVSSIDSARFPIPNPSRQWLPVLANTMQNSSNAAPKTAVKG